MVKAEKITDKGQVESLVREEEENQNQVYDFALELLQDVLFIGEEAHNLQRARFL